MSIWNFVAFSCSQINISQNSKPDLHQQVVMHSKPSVVRILNGCYGSFTFTDKGDKSEISKKIKDIDQTRYYYGGFGTGFFINQNGYIATHAVINETDCRKKLFDIFANKNKDLLSDNNINNEINELIEIHKYSPGNNSRDIRAVTMLPDVLMLSDL